MQRKPPLRRRSQLNLLLPMMPSPTPWMRVSTRCPILPPARSSNARFSRPKQLKSTFNSRTTSKVASMSLKSLTNGKTSRIGSNLCGFSVRKKSSQRGFLVSTTPGITSSCPSAIAPENTPFTNSPSSPVSSMPPTLPHSTWSKFKLGPRGSGSSTTSPRIVSGLTCHRMYEVGCASWMHQTTFLF